MTDTHDQRDRSDGWQLEGDSAAAYERYLVPVLFEPWADRLVENADLQPGDRVLDVGCGTGVVARRASTDVAPDGNVVGIDTNEGMLEVARTTAADRYPSIEWRRADATDLPFAEGAFDVVLCQQVLQFVPTPVAALREMRRVLDSDGRLALSVWRPIEFHPSYVTIADALERHVDEEAATMMRSPFPSWGLPEIRALVEDAGFRDVTITIEIGSTRYPSPEECVRREAASSPLAGPLGALSREVQDELIRDVAEALRAYTDDQGVVFPMETHLVSAHR